VTADLSGLTPFAIYHYRIVAIRSDGKGFPTRGRDQTFSPAPSQRPSVDETSFSNVSPTSVSLNALINPNKASTSYRFQYGLSPSYGAQTYPSESIGSDQVDHAVTSTLTGLQPGTTYHFRVVAVNINGPANGEDVTFNTPAAPAVFDTSATGITTTAATLGASLGAGYRSTTYHFEYGLTSTYSAHTPESSSIGADNLAHAVAATVSGLAPSTTYHYRVVANNEIGTTDGPDRTFTTAATPPESGGPPPPTPVACKKGFVKKHGKCVKKPKKHRSKHKRRGGNG
jgi:phosphodiesterase/alkaline phosphatase D-like protein